MIRLVILLLVAGMAIIPALAAPDGMTSTNDTGTYVVGQFAIISFDDEQGPENQANITPEENQTRRGGEISARKLFELKQAAAGESRNQTVQGEMTARKLFELKQAAREELQTMGNESQELSTGLSPTKAQSVAIVCKQCVPRSTPA